MQDPGRTIRRADFDVEAKMIRQDEVPTKGGQPDAAAMRKAKDARLRALEAEPHPLDHDGTAGPAVTRAVTPEASER